KAEDGIRDDLVTGVQTCALPILQSSRRPRKGSTKRMIRRCRFLASAAVLIVSAVLITPCLCAAQTSPRGDSFDVLIKGGMLYDGTDQPPRSADVGIRGDRIVAIGQLHRASAKSVIDATGLAVTPGFINMLSHSEV